MLIIGLGYKARQGKNAAALEMVNAAPIAADIRLVAFADALRKEVDTAIRQCGGAVNLVAQFKEAGLMPEWVRAETWPDKQRTILQWWGTDYRRAKDSEYWVKRMADNLRNLNPDIAIVTDVRFPNEADFIRSVGGVVVRVTRTSAPDVSVHEHESEKALDGYAFDYNLEAATLPDLKAKSAALFHEIVRTRSQCQSIT